MLYLHTRVAFAMMRRNPDIDNKVYGTRGLSVKLKQSDLVGQIVHVLSYIWKIKIL